MRPIHRTTVALRLALTLAAAVIQLSGLSPKTGAATVSQEFRVNAPGAIASSADKWGFATLTARGSGQGLVISNFKLSRILPDGTPLDPIAIQGPVVTDVNPTAALHAAAGNGRSYLWLRTTTFNATCVRIPQEGPISGLAAVRLFEPSPNPPRLGFPAVASLGGDFLAAWIEGTHLRTQVVPEDESASLGAPRTVASPGPITSLALAGIAGGYLATWATVEQTGATENRHTIWGLRLTPTGESAAPSPTPLATVTNPNAYIRLSLAANTGGYALAWNGGVLRLDEQGIALGNQVEVPATAILRDLSRDVWDKPPLVTPYQSGFVLGYVPAQNSSIFLARSLPLQGDLGPELEIRSAVLDRLKFFATVDHPRLVSCGDSLFAFYSDTRRDASTTQTAWVSRFNLTGPVPANSSFGQPFGFAYNTEKSPAIATFPAGPQLYWQDNRGSATDGLSNRIYRSRLTWDGTRMTVHDTAPIEGPGNSYRSDDAQLSVEGSWLLGRASQDGQSGGFALRRLDANGTVSGFLSLPLAGDFFGFNPVGVLGPHLVPIGTNRLVIAAGVPFDFRGPAFSKPQLRAQLYSPEFGIVTRADTNGIAVATAGSTSPFASLRAAGNAGGAAVIWDSGNTDANQHNWVCRLLRLDGSPAGGPPIQLPTDWSQADIASDGTDFLVAGLAPAGNGLQVVALRLRSDGTLSAPNSVGLPPGSNPLGLRLNGGPSGYAAAILLGIQNEGECHVQRFNADGSPKGSSQFALRIGRSTGTAYDTALSPLSASAYLVVAAVSLDEAAAQLRGAVVDFEAQPPLVYAAAPPDQTANLGAPFSFVVPSGAFTHTNPAATVKVTLNNLPPGLAFDASTRTLAGKPTQAGAFIVSLIATDDDTPPHSATGTFRITVIEVQPTNHPPAPLAFSLSAPARYGVPFSFRLPPILFLDSDPGQTVSTTVAALPPGITYIPGSATLVGVPLEAGDYLVSLIGTDTGFPPMSATNSMRLTVARAPLVITANDAVGSAGGPLPAFSARYQGFLGADTPAVLERPPVLSTQATTDSPPGIYSITPGGTAARNYEFTYVPGSLTLTPPARLTARISPDSRSIRLEFPVADGERTVLEHSADLLRWEETKSFTGPQTVVYDQPLTGTGIQFWRMRLTRP